MAFPVATLAMCFARLINSASQDDELVGTEGNAHVAILFTVMDITQTSELAEVFPCIASFCNK